MRVAVPAISTKADLAKWGLAVVALAVPQLHCSTAAQGDHWVEFVAATAAAVMAAVAVRVVVVVAAAAAAADHEIVEPVHSVTADQVVDLVHSAQARPEELDLRFRTPTRSFSEKNLAFQSTSVQRKQRQIVSASLLH